MMKPETFDTAAVRAVLSGRPTALQPLVREARIASGQECPECGDTDIMDNGERGLFLTFCCVGCGHQWEPHQG